MLQLGFVFPSFSLYCILQLIQYAEKHIFFISDRFFSSCKL
jgi:hypothetical protein